MSKIPYVDSRGKFSVEVQLQYAADVFLVDATNFVRYQNGEKFDYHGGHYTETPVRIDVSGSGRWFLVVSTSNYKYRFF